ncbi:hypothetical protein ASPWEDRAFT_30319 [Aspergillus wentii DTO 134E9]|uniref:Uncharacterized protein n=1 Tax=Aspergillus wentii DTO 134E9 TaxID=1073089 RepID=A0A1L9REB2_ASPWE|nr:uncharacterized protein ASPWEDRAFT_30319 [Aspergillus wentii DTO 134E9]OJJ33218.1 hypothetical protein ASPWEDRAFT_30319 [Aspergillus wentii DTO 134E9]
MTDVYETGTGNVLAIVEAYTRNECDPKYIDYLKYSFYTGQVDWYMKHGGTKFGFISTYEQTILIKQDLLQQTEFFTMKSNHHVEQQHHRFSLPILESKLGSSITCPTYTRVTSSRTIIC